MFLIKKCAYNLSTIKKQTKKTKQERTETNKADLIKKFEVGLGPN